MKSDKKLHWEKIYKTKTPNDVSWTFSENGPEKCSGLPISQYTDETLSKQFEKSFQKITCLYENHTTPFYTLQNFVFCSFKKLHG